MGSKVDLYKVVLNVSDIDRNYYQEHKFTLAFQSSVKETSIIARILAFALNADERLVYTKGIDTKHEPDLWLKDFTGDVELWIDMGEPDEKRVRKACVRSKRVIIYAYKGESSEKWWENKKSKLELYKNLSVMSLPVQTLEDLAIMLDRTMELQCTIQDKHVWIGNNDRTVEFDPVFKLESQ